MAYAMDPNNSVIKRLWCITVLNGLHQTKKCLRTCTKYADSDHHTHVQSIIRAFALHSYIQQYPMILLADSECLDQTPYMPEEKFLHVAAQLLIAPFVNFLCGIYVCSITLKRSENCKASLDYLQRMKTINTFNFFIYTYTFSTLCVFSMEFMST